MTDPGVHLVPSQDRGAEVDAVATRLGERVGLAGVLGDLDRTARAVRVPARTASWGFRWDREDLRSRRWWPQGISTSGDQRPSAVVDGRDVLITSSYARPGDGMAHGARLTVVDLTDRAAIRYRHVLLVEASVDQAGTVAVRPVHLHAGGIVWHAGQVLVAGTLRGLTSFCLDDVLRVPGTSGHRYLLPVRCSYDASTEEGTKPLRYSFASLDRSTSPPQLVTGEYSRRGPARLACYALDPTSGRLATHDGRATPTELHEGGVPRMQGAVRAHGTWYVTTSHGPLLPGSLLVGSPGAWRRHRWALPIGPEDLAYSADRDELWSVSEYPRARYVFAVPRSRVG